MDTLAPGDIVFNYERGYITVDMHGLVQQGPRAPETHHLQSYINDLVGRQVTAHTPEQPSTSNCTATGIANS